MLVLSRRESEKIVVPELGITLAVLSIKGNVVQLGIDAPPEIRIFRSEVLQRNLAPPVEVTCRAKPKPNESPSTEPQRSGPSQPLLAYVRKSQIEAVTNSSGFPSSEPRTSVREQRSDYEVCT